MSFVVVVAAAAFLLVPYNEHSIRMLWFLQVYVSCQEPIYWKVLAIYFPLFPFIFSL
jgi:hypothetical protein